MRLQGKLPEAREWLAQSLALAEQAQDATRLAEVLWQQAETYLAAGQSQAAQTAANRALVLAQSHRLPNLAYLSATALGKAWLQQKNNAQAAACFTQAIQFIEAARSQVGGAEQEAVTFFADKVEPYQQMVALLVAQNQPAEALLYAERAKGRVLLNVMRSGPASFEQSLTAAEKAHLQQLNRTLAQLNRQPPSASQATQLATARLAYESYRNDLFAAHPELRRRQGETEAFTLNHLARLVQPDTAYLEFVVTPSQTYLFTIKRTANVQLPEVHVSRLNIQADVLAQQVEQLHRRAAERSPLFAASARTLYHLLIKPAQEQTAGRANVVIVPDGCLWNVPFQALPAEADRYWLEDCAISYAPSLEVLHEMEQRPALPVTKATNRLFALGNPRLSPADINPAASEVADCPLPTAESEVKALAAVVGPARSRVLLGAQATETAFRAGAGNYGTVHLAAHGFLDNRRPLYSYLQLARGGEETEADGRLEAHEIMGLNLRAELVVLSACSTANGQISAGEGVIGLSWAFFVAGCRNTVVSQWQVNSESTAALMAHFYRALTTGQSRAQALRTASLALRQDARWRHPFYWAGFVMVGQGR